MTHFITGFGVGPRVNVPISEDRFNQVKDAQEFLLNVVAIEQKYDIILENYYEYEIEVSRIATKSMMFDHVDHIEMRNNLGLINRRIINLLTACRLYQDQSIHHIRQMFGENSEQEAAVGKVRSESYDTYIEYRTLEALRNYVQHYGYPAHRSTYASKKVDKGEDVRLQYQYLIFSDVSELAEDKRFKASVLKELRSNGERIVLNHYVRRYIDEISKAHFLLREMSEQNTLQCKLAVAHLIGLYLENERTRVEDVVMMISSEDGGEVKEEHHIGNSVSEYIAYYKKKNPRALSLSRSFITGEIDGFEDRDQ